MPKIDLDPTYFNVISFISENLVFPQSFSELDKHSKIILKISFRWL